MRDVGGVCVWGGDGVQKRCERGFLGLESWSTQVSVDICLHTTLRWSFELPPSHLALSSFAPGLTHGFELPTLLRQVLFEREWGYSGE